MTSPLEDAYQLAQREPTPLEVGEETLRYLGMDPRSIDTHALVLLCKRYRLDPLLGHVQLITARGGKAKPYITRDGMLEIAHRSGVFDGLTVDEQRRNTEGNGWTAYVSVWRKDMGHPFRYGAQCKDTEPQAKDGNGPEMALARAERRALRRAFNIPAYDEDGSDAGSGVEHVEPVEVGERAVSAPDGNTTESTTPTSALLITDLQRLEIVELLVAKGVTDQTEQLRAAGEVLGRPISRASQITFVDADVIIAELRGPDDLEAPDDEDPDLR